MKPKTKKSLIVMAAIAVIAAVIYFVARKRQSPTSIIDKLAVTDAQKAALKAKVAEIEANAAGISTWTKDALQERAAANGYTYNQWVVVEAAYALYYTSDWSLFDRIGQSVKTL